MNYPWEPPADFGKVVGQKSHFTIEQWGVGYAINVHRRGKPVETILARTPGEANQIRLKLSGEGLIGFMGGAAT